MFQRNIIKKLLGFLLLSVLITVGSLSVLELRVNSQSPPDVERQVNFKRHFDRFGVNGSILIYELKKERNYEYNPNRNVSAFLPA